MIGKNILEKASAFSMQLVSSLHSAFPANVSYGKFVQKSLIGSSKNVQFYNNKIRRNLFY